jgi:hypothetical protein
VAVGNSVEVSVTDEVGVIVGVMLGVGGVPVHVSVIVGDTEYVCVMVFVGETVIVDVGVPVGVLVLV